MAVGDGWGQFCTALSFRPLVVSGATDINGDFGSISALNPDTGPPHQPRHKHHHDLIATHLNLLPISMCQWLQGMNHSASLSPILNRTFAHHTSARLAGATKCQVGLCFLLRPWGRERCALHVGLRILLSSSLHWAEPCFLIGKGSQCLTAWEAGSWFVGRCCWSPLTGRDPR